MPFTTAIGTDSMMMALRTMFDPAAAADVSLSVQLWFGHDHFKATVGNGLLGIDRGDLAAPDATIETDPETLKQVALGGAPIDGFIDADQLRIYGQRPSAERFFSLFPLPVSVTA
ncbi:MAG: alkyl sulfatase C-terminal domain-containing protein [Stackebrandtia sp.]